MMSLECKIKLFAVVLATAVYFSGCCSLENLSLQNLDTAKKLVRDYHESGQFDKECEEIFKDAVSQIEKLPAEKNSAVIFDVDETSLSGYENTKKIGFGYLREHWHNGILKADEPAIKQTKIFYDWLISRSIKVIFLTGRYKELYDATKKNLVDQGFSIFDTLVVRNAGESKIPAVEFKARERKKLVEQGYNIIASVGDQWSDLTGDNTGIKIKLPNYLYLID